MLNTPAEKPRDGVPALLKASQVLDVLASARDPFTLADLTRQLGLPKSSVLALCNTLAHIGLVTRHADGRFGLGVRLVDLAHAYLAGVDLTREFSNVLDETGCTNDGVVLAVLDGTDVVYVGCRQGNVPLGVAYRIGMRLPASCTATGKALLSTLPDSRVLELYDGVDLPQPTRHSCANLATLIEDIRQVRNRGYAIDDQETREGMMCLGAPVFDASSPPAAAAVAVSMVRYPEDREKNLATASAVQHFARTLSRKLGASL